MKSQGHSRQLPQKKSDTRKRAFVGMSGGVDSSVSAALLVRDGYDVTGVFIKVWQPDWITCTWREDRLDAMRVAAQLGIKFETLDLVDTYKREVVDYMVAEYRAGRTPNPDVMCNRHVKFGGFFNWAMEQGADVVATGHYAKVARTGGAEAEIFQLVAGDDTNKDQSYFLWTLGQRELSKTVFPVGGIEKPEVRKLARKFGLATAEKKDSQGVCFIGDIDMKEFLSHYIDLKAGIVFNDAGKKIGTHDGAWLYTIGERHGFTITDKTPNDQPYYVVSKDVEKNTITVAQKMTKPLSSARTEISLADTNWTSGTAPAIGQSFLARARYRQPLVVMKFLSFDQAKKTAHVQFDTPQETLSPGQSLVVYDGTVCIGGGIIA